jgi:hypothetical protein
MLSDDHFLSIVDKISNWESFLPTGILPFKFQFPQLWELDSTEN